MRSIEETTGTRYKITVEEMSGGVIEVSELEPVVGQIVTIEVIPDAGNVVDTISVCDANGQPIAVTDNGNGTYYFAQPDNNVIIKATFKEDATGTFLSVLKNSGNKCGVVLGIALVVLVVLVFGGKMKRRRRKE